MAATFKDKIKASLANESLQAALDANTQKRITARQQALALLPDFQERRQRARRLRADVIANLDRYLDRFIENVRANGVMVHRAQDGGQAVQIILELARNNQAQLIAKSKTMVSEEIELNHALQAAGLRVVETDLGEFIVQLRGEKPSHLITPAMHLRRAEVGQTFHEKLGISFTEDVSILTDVARRELRQVFLSAEIGLSGVNFGVVETGTLCVLTNEGNGRMVTTVPPIHIALMSLERLVPTMDDLDLMLSLLVRSATGQKQTVYASLVNGPRHTGDLDGPLQRHLVLVDNGRSALRQSDLAEILYCIRCGACMNACPVFREIGGHGYIGAHGLAANYTGPMGSVLSPALFGQAEFGNLARASSLCGACKEACPVDIDLPKLLLRVRAGGVQNQTRAASRHVPLALNVGLRGFAWFAGSPARFHIAQKLAGLFSRLLAPFSPWLRLPALTGWGLSKDFPRPALKPFREIARSRAPDEGIGDKGEGEFQLAQNNIRNTAVEFSPSPTGRARSMTTGAEARESPAGTVAGVGELSSDLLIKRFEQELTLVGGQFIRAPEDGLADCIAELLRQRDIKEIMSWGEAYLPPGLLPALQERGISISLAPNANLRAGLTGALAGAAETATLCLAGGAGRPLSTSLLPQVHIAVLRAADLRQSVAELLNLPEVRQEAAAALVTGPSRTGDIELTLTIGVHGPKELIVVCLEEEG